MAVRTNSDPRYYRRFLLMGLAAVGFALWSLYDGAVTYPNQRERALAHKELEDKGRSNEWSEFARQRGWPTNYPGEPKSQGDITMQYVMAALAGTIGLALVFNVWRSRGRWIEASETGLSSSWGQSLNFDQIVSLDKKRWKNKGIARITYYDGKRRRRFVLDDYKFDRQTTDQILYELEAKIGIDKIAGGPPEAPLEEYGEVASDPAPERSADLG